MTKVGYRNPTKEDIRSITSILNSSKKEFPHHQRETEEEIMAWTFDEPDFDPSGYWLAIIDDRPIGYGGVRVYDSRIEAGMNDGWISVDVMPEYRGSGIEQNLMKLSIDYLKSRNISIAQQPIRNASGWRHNLALEFGFKDVRHSYGMVWKNGSELKIYNPPSRIGFEHKMLKDMTNIEIMGFIKKINEYYSEHYNYSSIPVKKIIKLRDISKEIIRTTFAKEGDEVVGACMYEETITYDKENGTKVGLGALLGVDKNYRGKGIGRALMSEFMRWAHKDRGMNTIRLSVDAKNQNALELYTSLGFEIDNEIIKYQLKIE